MTLDHGNLGPEDVRAVLRTGVSKQAIQDAFEVAFLFNIYDKLADSMGWDVPAISGGVLSGGCETSTQTRIRRIMRGARRSPRALNRARHRTDCGRDQNLEGHSGHEVVVHERSQAVRAAGVKPLNHVLPVCPVADGIEEQVDAKEIREQRIPRTSRRRPWLRP